MFNILNYCGNHQLVKNTIIFLDINVCPASVVQRANPIAYVDAGNAPVAFLLVHGVPTSP